MAHANDELSYRVVLLSESREEPGPILKPFTPIELPPRAEAIPVSAKPELTLPLAYQAVPIEESFSTPQGRPAQLPVPAAKPRPTYEVPRSAEPIHEAHEGDPQRRPRRLIRKPTRLPWRLERHGLECLGYLFHEPGLVGWLIGGLGLSAAIGSALFLFFTGPEPEGSLFLLLFVGLPIYTLCFLCGFWSCTLEGALNGEAGVVRWPGANVSLIWKGCCRCFWCLLTGPIVPLVAAFLFWLDAGELTTLDWLIVAELVFAASVYWLFSFLAVSEHGSIWKATPHYMIAAIRKLGWHAVLAALFMFGWTVIHGLWALEGIKELHHFVGSGWIALWFCSVSAVYWLTCLLRWLGVRSFLNRSAERRTSSAEPLWTPQLPQTSL